MQRLFPPYPCPFPLGEKGDQRAAGVADEPRGTTSGCYVPPHPLAPTPVLGRGGAGSGVELLHITAHRIMPHMIY
jgi:hypothetical protein